MSTEPKAVGEPPPVWYITEDQPVRSNASHSQALGRAQQYGYDLIAVSITTLRYEAKVFDLVRGWLQARNHEADRPSSDHGIDLLSAALLPPLSPEDTNLVPEETNSALIGKISPWIDLSSWDPVIAQVSRQVLKLELAYAAFCGLQNVILHGPLIGGDVVQYARAVLDGLGSGPYINLHVLFPMSGELEHDYDIERNLSDLANPEDAVGSFKEEQDIFAVWDTWNTLRSICTYSSRLAVALEIPRQLPPQTLQDRWFSEAVRLLVFPRTSFLRNAKGYPVLHRTQQQYLTRLMRLRFPPWLLLTDVVDRENRLSSDMHADPTPFEANTPKLKDPVPHLRYLRHLQQTQPEKTAIERFGHGYQDYIQSPLQPLTDNLESITYEVFEKDPIKYDWYEQATKLALRDLYKLVGRTIVVAVVGSGRGPLVSKALLAAQAANVPVQCWAVEKNPNAFVHLQRRNVSDPLWNREVTVVKSDMRAWAGPVIDGELSKVDILISELLGSFADNELSPECLDGVQHVLAPEHGVSIPQSYSAHLTPIATSRLHNDLLSRAGLDKWEIPVVVMLQQYSFLSMQKGSVPDVKEAWSFTHPLSEATLNKARLRAGGNDVSGGPGGQHGGDGSNEHNNRYCKLRFVCEEQGVCHGLAGYFETVLYESPETKEKVELSTNPVTMAQKSEDMISWFPLFFPLKTPLYVPANSAIEVSMWRSTDDRKVWYEWILEVFTNDNGRQLVAYSELHSSRKHGCLM